MSLHPDELVVDLFADGGRPKWKSVRSLPGVVLTWATRVRPRVIVVENVREMLGWGPLLEDGTPDPDRTAAPVAEDDGFPKDVLPNGGA